MSAEVFIGSGVALLIADILWHEEKSLTGLNDDDLLSTNLGSSEAR